MIDYRKFVVVLVILLGISFLVYQYDQSEREIISVNNYQDLEFGNFVEKKFPFITVSLDARDLGEGFPKENYSARTMAIQLGDSSFACFDMDLLRWSVAWTGDFMSMVLPAQGSYNDFFKKNNNELPHILGDPKIATGLYPGWSVLQPNFSEIRNETQKAGGLHWGPIPTDFGKWNGAYVMDSSVILSYSINGVEVVEMPGNRALMGQTAFTRTIKMEPNAETMFINAAEVTNGVNSEIKDNKAYIYGGENSDSVTVVAVNSGIGKVKIEQEKYIIVEVPKSNSHRDFTIFCWKGKKDALSTFDEIVENCEIELPEYKEGGPKRWGEKISTRGAISPDTAEFVTDLLTLPLPNPWNRNVRVADISFFSGNKAAISTYEGDVWTVEGIIPGLNQLKWKRYASGLFEPMSIEIVNEKIYVFGREGIVRLHDLNGDGEADYYENFCNLMQQSTGTREWAADMVADREGNFYIAKGGHLTGYKGVLNYITEREKYGGWRASTNHSGSVIKIDPTGENIEVVASGLRMPYLGINRKTGFLSASDQEGNFVPATPIYPVKQGSYFGVPITQHGMDSVISQSVTWIPHSVDRSAAGQTWVESNKMGSLSNQMVHISFGLPGLFKVLLDTTSNGLQGGIVNIKANYPAPLLKGETNPVDGQLYVAGFNNYASNSKGISTLLRLRYTGKQGYMLKRFDVAKQGVLLYFDFPLDVDSLSKDQFEVKRWNYKRSRKYGSGHYKSDGSPGVDYMPVLEAVLSEDKKKVFLILPEMKTIDQMKVHYSIFSKSGKQIEDDFWFTIHQLDDLDIESMGFPKINFDGYELDSINFNELVKSDLPVSRERGKELFTKSGCVGCHSAGNETDGMYGPPFAGLFGSEKEMETGEVVEVNEDYIRESIIDPGKRVPKGYSPEMPSFNGILKDSDITSLLLYIKSL